MDDETLKMLGDKQWPTIMRAIDVKPMITHLSEWCKNHQGPGASRIQLKEEIKAYLVRELITAPRVEIVDALCETMSATIYQKIYEANKPDDE